MSHRSRKKPPQGGFFRLQSEDYAQRQRISRGSFAIRLNWLKSSSKRPPIALKNEKSLPLFGEMLYLADDKPKQLHIARAGSNKKQI